MKLKFSFGYIAFNYAAVTFRAFDRKTMQRAENRMPQTIYAQLKNKILITYRADGCVKRFTNGSRLAAASITPAIFAGSIPQRNAPIKYKATFSTMDGISNPST